MRWQCLWLSSVVDFFKTKDTKGIIINLVVINNLIFENFLLNELKKNNSSERVENLLNSLKILKIE